MTTLTDAALACVQHADAAGNVTLIITYNATFGPLERHLAGHGLVFEERIEVVGEDFGESSDIVLHKFPVETVPVSRGTAPLIVSRRRTLTISRKSLREDPGLFGHDELHCCIDLAATGLPTPLVSAATDVRNGAAAQALVAVAQPGDLIVDGDPRANRHEAVVPRQHRGGGRAALAGTSLARPRRTGRHGERRRTRCLTGMCRVVSRSGAVRPVHTAATGHTMRALGATD